MKFSLRRLLAAVALAAAALAFERSLDALSAGGSTAVAATALFVAMFTSSGAAIGVLCHRGGLGAMVGLVLAGILSPFFWIVWRAADC